MAGKIRAIYEEGKRRASQDLGLNRNAFDPRAAVNSVRNAAGVAGQFAQGATDVVKGTGALGAAAIQSVPGVGAYQPANKNYGQRLLFNYQNNKQAIPETNIGSNLITNDVARTIGNAERFLGQQAVTAPIGGVGKIKALEGTGVGATKKLLGYSAARAGEGYLQGALPTLTQTGDVRQANKAGVGGALIGGLGNMAASPILGTKVLRDVRDSKNLGSALPLINKQYDEVLPAGEAMLRTSKGAFNGRAPKINVMGEELGVARSVDTRQFTEKGFEEAVRKGGKDALSFEQTVEPFKNGSNGPKVSVDIDRRTGEILSIRPDRSNFGSYLEGSAPVSGKKIPRTDLENKYKQYEDLRASSNERSFRPDTPEEAAAIKQSMEADRVQFRTQPKRLPAGDPREAALAARYGDVPSVPAGTDVAPAAKELSFAKGAQTSPELAEGTQNALKDQNIMYDPRSNKELQATVNKQIDAMGYDSAIAKSLDATDLSDEAVARSIEVSRRLSEGGQHAQATDVIMKNAERLLQAGRAVQAASLLKRLTPEGIQSLIARNAVKAGKTVDPETMKKAADLMKAAQDLPEGRSRNLGIQKAFEYANGQFPSSAMSQALDVWKAGLLTGLKTTGINVAGNTANALLERAKDLPASAIDAGIGMFTGQRTKTATLRGGLQGAKRGLSEGWDYLVSGYDPGKVGSKFEDGGKTVFSDNFLGKAAKNYTEGVFRFIGSQDRPFYYSAMYNSLYDQAGAQAINQGLKGKAREAFIQEFVNAPTEQAGLRAAKDAEQAVYQNETRLGNAAGQASKALGPVGKLVMPFTKTPSAVAMQVVNYTPVGIAKSIIENVGKGKFDQRQLSEGIARGLTGTGLLAVGWEIAKAGAVNTSYPASESERALWEAENRKPNTLVLGNTQIDLQALGPAGNAIAAGASAYQAQQKGKPAFAAGAAGAANAILESPFLSGTSDLIDLVKKPVDNGGKYIARQTGSVIPTIVSDAAQTLDRNAKGEIRATKPEGAREGLLNRIPILRKGLDSQYDVLGQERTTGKDTFQTLADPTRSQDLTTTPITEELNRLRSTTDGVDLTRQKESLKAFGEELKLNPSQLNQFQKETGDQISARFSEMISSPEYAGIPDDMKAKLLTGIVSDVKEEAKNRYVTSGGSPVQAPGSGLIPKASAAAPKYTQAAAAYEDRKAGRPVGTTPSEKPAPPSKDQIARAKYQVESGSEETVDLGDRIVRTNPETGEAQVITKASIESATADKRYELETQRALAKEDFAGWEKLQREQFNRLDQSQKLLDPVIDAAKILDIENKKEDIAAKAVKYRSYGGAFKKPKKGKKIAVKRISGSASKPKQVTIKNIRVKGR